MASPGVVRKIIGAAHLSPDDKVLEIGPGLGALTESLLPLESTLTAVELDSDIVAFLQARWPHLRLIHGDAANLDWNGKLEGNHWKCVSNLPYNVGTRIVTNLLTMHPKFTSLVVMLQREVAEKMVARVGDRNRGSLSVFVQMFSTAKIVIRVPPGAFYPPPKVDSAVLSIHVKANPRIGYELIPQFEAFLRALFSQPRKTIRNCLKKRYQISDLDLFFSSSPISSSRRAASLREEEIIQIFNSIEKIDPLG